eukprot:453798-Prorocentrum_minimum.AAC.1
MDRQRPLPVATSPPPSPPQSEQEAAAESGDSGWQFLPVNNPPLPELLAIAIARADRRRVVDG